MKLATESVFCWLLTSLLFHAEVDRATNEDAAWEKKVFPLQFKAFLLHREPPQISKCLVFPFCYYY